MPPFNGRQIQQQLLVFIQLQIIMYFQFLRQTQQPPSPAPPYRDLEEGTTCGSGHGYCRERRGGLPQHYG